MYLRKNSVSTLPVRDQRQFTENETLQARPQLKRGILLVRLNCALKVVRSRQIAVRDSFHAL
jgi:hypothetical protein